MSVQIKVVKTKREFRAFATFANKLYKGNRFYVPTMPLDDLAVFDRNKNAAYEFCEAEFFMAYKDGNPVGRIAAIINSKANAAWNVKQVRYGWIDFIDDMEVSSALLETVAAWGRERGMTQIAGPLGFTDFDPEGMLVEGFDRLGTMSMIYNHEYYHRHLEKLGYVKETDWIEFRINIPEILPERFVKMAELVQERYKLRVVKKTRRQINKERYGHKLFRLINETYCNLYGFSLLSDKQIDQYVDQYLGFIDLKMVTFIEDENGELIAAGITMPSLSKALQKCGGNLFPIGWWYLVKNMYLKKPDTLDMLLVGIKPEYQNKGVNAMLFVDMFSNLTKLGFKYAETSAELETNIRVQQLWNSFDKEQHKRRRVYVKEL
jgi:GNAT superfamily N-acetyltransferase